MLKELFRQAKVDINITDVYSRIENMYLHSDLQSIRPHLTSPQAAVFQKELDTLKEFGLRKELSLRPKYEILSLSCQVDGIKLKRYGNKTKVKNIVSKLNLHVKRQKHVLTPVYYELDQYKCKNCGGNQILQNQTSQICAYCGTENLQEENDWVLA